MLLLLLVVVTMMKTMKMMTKEYLLELIYKANNAISDSLTISTGATLSEELVPFFESLPNRMSSCYKTYTPKIGNILHALTDEWYFLYSQSSEQYVFIYAGKTYATASDFPPHHILKLIRPEWIKV